MTTLINPAVTRMTTTLVYGALSNGVAGLAVILLLVLLVEKVLLEAYESRPVENKMGGFTILIWPLLFVLAVTIFLRVAQVLHIWS